MGWSTGFWRFERVEVVGMSPSCESTAPTPYAKASVWRKKFFLKLGCLRTGAAHSQDLRVSKALNCGSSQCQLSDFFVRSSRGQAISENHGMKYR